MPRRQFTHMVAERTRHGTQVLYFRRGQGERIRLPPLDHPEFMASYNACLAGQGVPYHAPSPQDRRRERVLQILKVSIQRAKGRGLPETEPFDLTAEWAWERVQAQGFRCAVTGIPFLLNNPSKSRTNPYLPSLDRIDPSRSYSQANVRIVIFALNMMLSDWGQGIFEHVIREYLKRNPEASKIPHHPPMDPAPVLEANDIRSLRGKIRHVVLGVGVA